MYKFRITYYENINFYKVIGMRSIVSVLAMLYVGIGLNAANANANTIPGYLDVFIDRQGEVRGLHHAIQLPDEYWKKVASSKINLPVRHHHFWIRFAPEEPVEDNYLWFKYALIDTVRAWIVHPNDSIEYLGEAGNLIPHSKWPRKFRYPVFAIESCKGCIVYLEAQKTTYALSFSLALVEQRFFSKLQLYQQLVFGAGFGIGFFVICISLVIWLKLKLPLAFYYFFLTFCILGYVYHAGGFTFMYLFPENPKLNPFVRNFSAAFLPISYLLLTEYCLRYINTKKIFWVITRIHIGFSVLFFLVGNSFFFVPPSFISNLVGIGHIFTLYLVIANFIVCTVAYLMYRGNLLLLLSIGGLISLSVGMLYVLVRIFPNLNLTIPVTSFYTLYVYLFIVFGIVLFIEIVKYYKGYQNAQREILKEQLTGLQNMINSIQYERQRLGRDLHDFVNPLLTGSRLSLHNLIKQQKDFKRPLQEVDQNIERAHQEVRRIAHGLTSINSNTDLEPYVKDLIEKANTYKNRNIELEWQLDEDILSDIIATQLSGILLEVTNNMIEHEECKHCSLKVSNTKNEIHIEYTDIEDKAANGNGIGRKNIAARVKLLNGKKKQIKENGAIHTKIMLPVATND